MVEDCSKFTRFARGHQDGKVRIPVPHGRDGHDLALYLDMACTLTCVYVVLSVMRLI